MEDVDTCPTCGKGKLEDGVTSLPNECCAFYFYGEGSGPHRDWVSFKNWNTRIAKFDAEEETNG